MKLYNSLRIASLISYCLIMISGSMIGLPLIICLFSWSLDFGTLIELFAIFAFVAIIGSFILMKYQKTYKTLLIEIVLLGMLLSPLVERLISFSFVFFETVYFILPVSLFMVLYLCSIILSYRQIISAQRTFSIGDT